MTFEKWWSEYHAESENGIPVRSQSPNKVAKAAWLASQQLCDAGVAAERERTAKLRETMAFAVGVLRRMAEGQEERSALPLLDLAYALDVESNPRLKEEACQSPPTG